VGLEAVAFAGDELWWSESRPSEGGRVCVCRADAAGTVIDLLPAPWNARTRVHEYGGTAWLPVPTQQGFDLVFANFSDQRLYRLTPGSEPVALTPAPKLASGLRYAELQLDASRSRLLAVRETHRGDGTFGTVDRTIVAIALDTSPALLPAAGIDLLVGSAKADFVAGPRLSASGDALLWISWCHPDMPWDSTIAHLAKLDRAGAVVDASDMAGGPGISVVDPGFLPDGSVLVISDENGFWQPLLLDPRSGAQRWLTDRTAEFAAPLWVLGRRQWAVVPGGRVLVRPDGRPSLLDTFSGDLTELDSSWTGVTDMTTDRSGRLALIVQSDICATQLVVIDSAGRKMVIRSSVSDPLPAHFLPVPELRIYQGVHVVLYPPTNPHHSAEQGHAPVIITIHGGPTSAHSRALSAHTAYFTSRGFAVAAVDHRGSTGYGRPYRDALKRNWAQLDIQDAITAATGLLADGTAGSAVISGGSAGGLTVLGALTTAGNPFSAGVSAYGIGDLHALLQTTHDFESRYLLQLLGNDPATLTERSPLHRASALATPVLLLQGGKDPIVTSDQANSFAAACLANGVPHALIVFPEEGHGFRAAAARKAALEAELAFYGQVLGFPTPGVDPIVLC